MLQVLTYSNFFFSSVYLGSIKLCQKLWLLSITLIWWRDHFCRHSLFLLISSLVSIYVSFSSLVLFLDLMTAVRGFWNPQILTTSQGYLEKIFFYSLHNAMFPVNPQWHWIMVTSTLTQFQQYSDPLTFMIDVQWHVSV